jgi:hypothetical protein
MKAGIPCTEPSGVQPRAGRATQIRSFVNLPDFFYQFQIITTNTFFFFK